MSDVVQLRQDTAHCVIHPLSGGSLTSWSVAGQNLLRAASDEAVASGDPLRLSTFPLVPYSNRIGYARFPWEGRAMTVTPNFAPEPHAIHGVGWKRQWAVVSQTDASATLRLEHQADHHWPWAFEAEQTITLEEKSLIIRLRATNRAEIAAPLAFGHHPYFDQAGASLAFLADAVWMSGTDALPTQRVQPRGQFDFALPAPVEGRNIDHCYAGVDGPARITWADRRLGLEIFSAPQLRAAVVYVPEGGDAFCFEPVPHINNALNLPGEVPAIPVLAPGETSETILTFRAFTQ